MIIDDLSNDFSKLDSIIAVALSGSSTALIKDEFSDYDLYVYYSGKMPEREERKELLSKYGVCKIGLDFFEEGDELITQNGKEVDIMYRDIAWIRDQIEDVWIKHNARLGYTTCFIFNVKNSKILFDRKRELSSLKKLCSSDYPEDLRMNIIKRNMYLLDGDSLSPYIKQLKLAAIRGDIISLEHRTTAFLASYFDVLFAFSRSLHPGEKKLLGYLNKLKIKKPEHFDENVSSLLSSGLNTEKRIKALDDLLSNLNKMLGPLFNN